MGDGGDVDGPSESRFLLLLWFWSVNMHFVSATEDPKRRRSSMLKVVALAYGGYVDIEWCNAAVWLFQYPMVV